MHVAAVLLRGERVQLLLHLEHVQGGDTQDLGLAALEQRRAVDARDHADLGVQRPDVGQAAAVDADLVAQHALAHELLVQRAERRADLLLAALELAGELLEQAGLDRRRGASSRSCLPAMVSASAVSALTAASTAA